MALTVLDTDYLLTDCGWPKPSKLKLRTPISEISPHGPLPLGCLTEKLFHDVDPVWFAADRGE